MSTDASLLDRVPHELLIGGRWVAGDRGVIEVTDPADGSRLAEVADASPEQGLAALAAADAARRDWARTPARERSELLRAAFDAVVERTEDFAHLMTREMGKPLAEARGEVTYGAEFLRWNAEEAVRIDGGYHPAPEGTLRQLVLRRPVGPCLLITPWNFPLAMATRKIAPALAAGCTAVIRPASLTPLTTLLLAQVLQDCGLPDGVLNVITSTEHDVTDAVIADPRLRKLSFTGSTAVGRTLLRQAADTVLRTSMELGGNAPFLVFEDADLDVALEAAAAAKLRNMGQACTAANRFLVHESVAEEFGARLAERFAGLRVGAGTAEGTDIGPLITPEARERVHTAVQEAVGHGARVLTGGAVPEGPGAFYPPTVVTGVDPGDDLFSCEIFGPVAAVSTFADETEAVARANDTDMGLASYVITRDPDRILRLTEELEYGLIGVNLGVLSNAAAPFGGVKQSGIGREGGVEGIDEYLEPVYVAFPDPRS